jgi:hypothetical protein
VEGEGEEQGWSYCATPCRHSVIGRVSSIPSMHLLSYMQGLMSPKQEEVDLFMAVF